MAFKGFRNLGQTRREPNACHAKERLWIKAAGVLAGLLPRIPAILETPNNMEPVLRWHGLAAGPVMAELRWLAGLNAELREQMEEGPMPIDVYDAVAWSAITPLSEQSIAEGYKTLEFPDFTGGLWNQRKPIFALGDRY